MQRILIIIVCLLAINNGNAQESASATVEADAITEPTTGAAAPPFTTNEDQADYASLAASITPQSSIEEYRRLWKAYLNSEAFITAHTSDQVSYLEVVDFESDAADCQEQLPLISEQLTDHFPNLSLNYMAMRCHTLLQDSEQASHHEQIIAQLSAVMTANGDGSSTEKPLWAGSTMDAMNFLSLLGYEIIDTLFHWNKEQEQFFYIVLTRDEEQQSENFYFDSSDLINSLINAHLHETVGDNELVRQALDHAVGKSQALNWLAAQGDSAANILMGDTYADSHSDTGKQAALTYYLNAAELQSPIAANRYAQMILEHKFTEQYETAADLLVASIEQRECYSVQTLIQMYEKSLGVQRDEAIIGNLIELCTKHKEKADFLYQLGLAFFQAEGAHYDVDLALKYIDQAADLGHTKARMEMARVYLNGRYAEQDLSKGFAIYDKLVQEDHVPAIIAMGYYLGKHPDFQGQYGTHIDYAIRASEHGDATGQHNMGIYYRDGNGVDKDHNKAKYWFTKAYEQNYADSHQPLAMLYLFGEGIPPDYPKALEILKQCLTHEKMRCYNTLGYLYELGLGTAADPKQAKAYYDKGEELGNTVAKINSTLLGYRSNHPYLNTDETFDRIREEADNKLPEGLVALSILYRRGTWVRTNYDEADRLLRKAANKDYAPAQYSRGDREADIARILRRGVPRRARKQLKQASEAGIADASYRLAMVYADKADDDDDDDWEDAYHYYLTAARQGHDKAAFHLATLYENGLGVETDIQLAIQWYQQAAEAGSGIAMNNLATLYLEGERVPQDIPLGLDYLQQAASSGLNIAMRNLGRIYRYGHYGKQDLQQALDWYIKASDGGDNEATLHIGELLTVEPAFGPNHDIARLYFLAAANKKNTEGFFWLARSYELQPDEDIETEDIYKVYQAAAEAGNTWAMNNLAIMHLSGEAPDADEDDARDLLEDAHEAGNHSATANLAWCYEHGLGGRKRMNRAMELYRQAAVENSPFALSRLATLSADANSEYYDPDMAAGYSELLSEALKNRLITTAARSLIPLAAADSAAH
ncbi:MAG: hypothetical protein Tsb002_30730 [Wenzhouxiangellaceae bacterium]